jgi:hypothetical protein
MSKHNKKQAANNSVNKDKSDDKVSRVMTEFKEGRLKSSSGKVVTDKAQALAIALGAAGISNKNLNKAEMINRIRVYRASVERALMKEIARDETIRAKVMSFYDENDNIDMPKITKFAEKNGMKPAEVVNIISALFKETVSDGMGAGSEEKRQKDMTVKKAQDGQDGAASLDGKVELNDITMIDKIFAWFMVNPYPQDHEGLHKYAESLGLEPSILETYIYAIVSCFLSGGNFNKSKKKIKDFDPEEIRMGKIVEMEHVDKDNLNPVVKHIAELIAERISLDHISDNPKYYAQGKAGTLKIEELAK